MKAATTTRKRKGGRPPGKNYRRGITVRLTPETHELIKAARKLFGFSYSKMIRAGLDRAMAEFVPRAVAIAKEHEKSGRRALAMLEFLRLGSFHTLSESAQGRTLREELDNILEDRRQRRPYALRPLVEQIRRQRAPRKSLSTAELAKLSEQTPIRQSGAEHGAAASIGSPGFHEPKETNQMLFQGSRRRR